MACLRASSAVYSIAFQPLPRLPTPSSRSVELTYCPPGLPATPCHLSLSATRYESIGQDW